MKEHPIIFSTPMVKAILEGRKTQTRRLTGKGMEIINANPNAWHLAPYHAQGMIWNGKALYQWDNDKLQDPHGESKMCTIGCPYGQAGDRLWVREAHRFITEKGTPNDFGVVFKDGCINFFRDNAGVMNYPVEDRWRPSIFMPRWASRILLEITEVRVQRVREISEQGATAEGINEESPLFNAYEPHYDLHRKDAFCRLWGSINAKHPWGSNPWVWVVSFRKLNEP